MKALQFAATGALGHLHLVERPLPRPADGEVLVRISAAGLNTSDVSNVLGKHPYTTLPRIPGRDFAGVVVDGPPPLRGKAVWGTGKELGFTRDGSHAEFIVVPADGVALKPEALSFAQAASCGVPFTTAWSALERCVVGRGCRVLVIGAAGAVGSAALSLGRARKAEVAGAVRRPEQARALEARGTRAILLAEGQPLAEAAKGCFPAGADVVLDTTGAWLADAVSVLAPYGRIAVIVAQGDGRTMVPVRDLYRRAGSIVGVNSLLYDAAECASILSLLSVAFDTGELAPPEGMTERPLERGVDTYAELNGGVRRKFVFASA